MSLVKHMQSRLQVFGVPCEVVGEELHIIREPRPVKIRFDDEWCDAFDKYNRARSLTFEEETRTLLHNNSLEVFVTRLAPAQTLAPDQYTLTDSQGNTVSVGTASYAFGFAFFDSFEYEEFFNLRVRRRLLETHIFNRLPSQILWMPTTASYTSKGQKRQVDFKNRALSAIRASLFKIAVEQDDCLSIWRWRKPGVKHLYPQETKGNNLIPRVTYDETVISYYKVAKASPFPSQSYLAYYHVLEYYFLRVSELLLHDRLTAMINDPRFHVNRKYLDKVISAVRGQDSRSDETEMLRNVLDRFVQESDLINFIEKFEESIAEKIYSKRRLVFGENLQISLQKDHAIANSAKVLKHIRNAIVHSSDKYKRDDCHIPLSDSEALIEEFIPLVRFFAERVIYGTAS
ncbi:hypothetical protein [Alcaligenes faecalis]|uniref:hypothetical protein n=1 Tax=Alcaligenes faecalis TaxID=511 RepID=UPI000E14E6AE|nr:hypothetical protein [Alcaligenes faecalis]SSY76731.1 Uncharacterised protein [Alcaligenes faecalis subsp. faecalis]